MRAAILSERLSRIAALEFAAAPAIGGIALAGIRPVIDLAEVRYDKIRARIDEVIRKLLAGEVEKGKECWGLCAAVVGG